MNRPAMTRARNLVLRVACIGLGMLCLPGVFRLSSFVFGWYGVPFLDTFNVGYRPLEAAGYFAVLVGILLILLFFLVPIRYSAWSLLCVSLAILAFEISELLKFSWTTLFGYVSLIASFCVLLIMLLWHVRYPESRRDQPRTFFAVRVFLLGIVLVTSILLAILLWFDPSREVRSLAVAVLAFAVGWLIACVSPKLAQPS